MRLTKSKGGLLRTAEQRKSFQGFLFITPWLLGFAVFFLFPVIQSIWYSFSISTPIDSIEGGFFNYLKNSFIGIEHYRDIWTVDTEFNENLFDSIAQFIGSLPIILFLSLVFGLVLNQDFQGRMIVRALFFLPVIITGGVVMEYLSGDANAQQLLSSSEEATSMYSSFSFSNMLDGLGLPDTIIEQLNGFISQIFTLVWNSGVQTILFLAGLQAISAQYYEVAEVEGATKWETFWFVTFPMLTNVLILNTIYTCIDLFIDNSNKVMSQAYTLIEKANYNKSAAIMWTYFTILMVVMGVLLFIFRKPIKQVEI